MLSMTRMEHTHILKIQLNTKKQERDFRIENLLSEADKGRRAIKKN